MLTLITRSFRPDSTAQQRTAGIETAVGIADHPSVAPALRVSGAPLRFDNKSDGSDLITTVTELVPMPTLKDEERR